MPPKHSIPPPESTRLTDDGAEILDDTPVAIPMRIKKMMNDTDRIQAAVQAISRAMEEAGEETFEEADDFDVGEDYDLHPFTQYELDSEVAELVAYDRYERRTKTEEKPPPEGTGKSEQGVQPSGEEKDPNPKGPPSDKQPAK